MKDFDQWNSLKKKIHNTGNIKYYRPRDIWWCSLGINIGSEQDGSGGSKQRPVVIIKDFGTTCLVIPLTTSYQVHKYRFSIGVVDGKQSKAKLSQLRLIDARRLTTKIGGSPTYFTGILYEII